jgi:murein DD-endopeptidase MepM/ murein hydrolase activator NlpD
MKRRRRRFCSVAAAVFGEYSPAVRQPRTNTGLSTEALEDRSLLSNLSLAEAFLVDGQDGPMQNPILGQQIEVRASFTTASLSQQARYAVRIMIDGVAIDRAGNSLGAGLASGGWSVDVMHGFAEPGERSVQVILDPFNEVIETNEDDNSFTFTFLPQTATDLPQKLSPVVGGTAGIDWRITNFSDLDPRPGIMRDYRGGQFTYDTQEGGHNALDIGPGTFSAMDKGMAVVAAADGVVAEIHDGEFDRNTSFAAGSTAANFVTVDLGNDWKARYWHLRRDSVSVRIGDVVQRGDFLGWMGSSGFSTGPHVHFELTWRNHPVETMLDADTYWVTPPAYPADYRHAMQSGLSSRNPTQSEWDELPENMSTFVRGNQVYFWIIAGAMLPGDTRTVQFQRPDGSVYFEQSDVQGDAFYKASQWYYFITLPSDATLGTWTAVWSQNNTELARKSFHVALNGLPELRVELGTSLIRSDRFTPVDFETTTVGATTRKRTFSITNQGPGTLNLGNVSLPSGFQIVSSPAMAIAAGQSTSLTIQLSTSSPGYFAGELRMLTNDPDETVFRIWLEGVVEAIPAATLIPGISIRSASEGTHFFANVRRTGAVDSALTVNLESSDTSELVVPTTVTIPAGASFVNFEVFSPIDSLMDGDQRIFLTASASGLSAGRNEILIRDVDSGNSPAPPSITVPATAQLNSTITLSWSAVANVNHYEVWVNFVTGQVSQIVHSLVTENSLTVPGFAEMGVYRIWVRAITETGYTTAWSPAKDIRIQATVTLTPLARHLDSASPTFSWNAVSTATHYDLWMDDVLNSRSQVIRRTDLTTTSFTVPAPLEIGLYRVWVRAIDQRGQATPWSLRQEFYVAPRPSTGPTAAATFDHSPALRWDAVAGAHSYEIWFRNGFTGADLYRVSDVAGTQWTVPEDLSIGRYHWWVRALGVVGTPTLWSVTRDLWVGGQPTLQAPFIEASRLITFRWLPVEGAASFQLQVDRIDVPQIRTIRNDSVTGLSWQSTSPLAPGLYRVWMRAVSAPGELSYWSKAIDFVVT